jgi:NhaA family Na+:H+ antiporter
MLGDRRQLGAIDDIHVASGKMLPAGLWLEQHLHPLQAWLVLPLFAFFNAGVRLGGGGEGSTEGSIGLGIVAGLFFGKQVGVTAFSWIAVKAGWADLPEGVSWSQIYGLACLAGIGFTMSLFIGELAFSDPALIDRAKLGILVASLLSGVWGVLVLAKSLPRSAAR